MPMLLEYGGETAGFFIANKMMNRLKSALMQTSTLGNSQAQTAIFKMSYFKNTGLFKFGLAMLMVVMCGAQGWGQTTIVNYDFNSGSSYGSLSPSLATNITSTISSTEAFTTFGGTATGSGAFVNNATAGNSIAMNNSSGSNTKYFQFQLGGSALSSYGSYKIYLQSQRSGTGATTITLAYSTDGSSFTNFATTQSPGNGSFNENSFDISGVTGLNSQSAVYFRLLASGASSTGTLRIDNFQVSASLATTNYYLSSGADPSVAANWGTNVNGSGSAPSAMNITNAVWNVTENSTTTTTAWANTWTLGSGSSVALKANNTFNVAGTLVMAGQQIVAAGTGATVNVTANGTVQTSNTSGLSGSTSTTISNTNSPTVTLNSSSTVNYNGTGAQTVTTGTYGNLTLSGSRTGSPAITLASGTIGIAGTLSVNATGIGSYVVTGNTIDFSSSGSQTIPAINYNNITNTGNGSRTLASSGTISIAGTFTPGSGVYTITGSTVAFIATSGTIAITLPTVSSGNSFNALTINGSGGIFTLPASASVQNLATTLNVQAGTLRLNNSNTQSNTISVGVVNLSGGTLDGSSGTVASPGTILRINTSWNQTAGLATTSGSGTARLLFTGGGNTTFTGLISSSNFIYWTIQISNSTTLTLASNVSVNGISSPGTILTVDAGSILTAGTFTITSNIASDAISILGRVQTANTNGFSGASNTTIVSTNTPTITLGSASTIEYNAASGTQTVTARSDYANIIMSGGGGTKTLTSSAVASSSFTISNGTTFSLTSSLSVGGAWSNSGTFTPNSSTVTFNGTSAQAYTRTGTGSFNNLTLNNSNGLSLNNDLTITTTLTFTSGKITTGSNKVIALGTVSGGGTGWVIGNLQKPVTATGSKTFEIGGTSNYRPINVNYSSVVSGGSLTASVSQSDGNHPSLGTSLLDATKTVKRYFTLTPSGALDGTYDATFNFVAADVPGTATPANFVIGKYNSGTWAYPTVGTKTSTSTQLTGSTTYGDYAIGESAAIKSLTASALASFGSVCINTTDGPRTFTINGTNLDAGNISVAALAGFTYSEDNVTYSTSLSISQPGGTFTRDIFVKFSPTVVQSYSGNIVLSGGGAADYNVAASGSGVNTPPTVGVGSASSITSVAATVSGTISSTGCSVLTAYGIEYSTANNFTNGTGTQVAGNSLSAGSFNVSISGLAPSTIYYFKTYATNSGGTSYSAQASFTTATPSLTVGTLTAFGGVCINTTAGPNSFTVSGTNLTGADVTVAALTGYTYSTTSGGTYTTTLTLTAFSGSSTNIYVKFTPTNVQSYSGSINVSGGGAASKTVAASGSGVNTSPTVTTGSVGIATSTGATLPGTISSTGCTSITAYGIEYSTTSGFANGTGTMVVGSNLSGSAFSVALSSLNPNTTYYFKAYATNDGGTGYGGQQSFTTSAIATPTASAASAITATGFTANWSAVPGASGYRLDVSENNLFSEQTIVATEDFENSFSLFSVTGGTTGAFQSGTTAASGDLPASSPFAAAGAYGYYKSNGSVTLTSSNINTTAATGSQMSFKLASFSVGSTGNGADASDIVTVDISPNGGTNYYSTLRVLGNSNAVWEYAATGVASTAYDGNATPVDFSPANGGNRTADGYSLVTITGLPSTSNLKIRITLLNNNSAEYWVIDDLKITGDVSSFVSSYNGLDVGNVTSYPVTGLTGGTTYFYRVRATSPNSTSANSNTITVKTCSAVPTVNSPVTYCQNATAIPLAANGENLLWYTTAVGGTGSSTAPTPSTATAGTTNYYVSQTQSGTCESARSLISVIVNAAPATPTISGGGTICQGSSANITTSYVLGTDEAYLWSTGETTSSIEVGTAGTYTLQIRNTVTNCLSAASNGISVTVNPTTVGGTVAADQTICLNTQPADLTLSGNVGDVIKWQSSSDAAFTSPVDIAVTSTTLTGAQIGTLSATTYFRAVVQSGVCSVENSSYVTITINPNTTFTDAGGDHKFSNPANWSCGIVPPTNALITVATGNNLSLDVDFTIASSGSLTLTSGSTLTIEPAASLTIAGTADFAGQPVTLQSTALSTARIGQVTGTLNGATLVTVERYIGALAPGKRAYRLLTAPLRGTTNNSIFATWQNNGDRVTPNNGTIVTSPAGNINNNGIDTTSLGYSLQRFNISSGQLNPVGNTKSERLFTSPAGRAGNNSFFLYVRADRPTSLADLGESFGPTTLKATGTLQTGEQVFNLNPKAGAVPGGLTLVGNPFAAPVDFKTIAEHNTSISKVYYFWDPYLGGNFGSGGYVSGAPNLGGDYDFNFEAPDDAEPYSSNIQSGQAIFVVTEVDGASQTMTIGEADKTAVNKNTVFRSGSQNEMMSVTLQLMANGKASNLDGTLARYNNGYAGTNGKYDADKLANSTENIFLFRNGRSMSIESRPLADDGDTMFLRVSNLGSKTYQLTLTPTSFNAPNLAAFLEDNYLHTSTQISLTEVTKIQFTATSTAESKAADRFMLVYKQITVLPINFTNVKAFEKGNSVQVEWNLGNELGISRYEVEKSADGRSFTKAGTQSVRSQQSQENYNWLDASPVAGNNFYRIKAIEQNGTYKYSQVVNVKLGKGNSTVAVYPNPVKSGVMSLQLVNQPAGKYSVVLINNLGQQVYVSQFSHAGGSATQTIQLNSKVVKGVYQLQLTNGKEQITQQVIVE